MSQNVKIARSYLGPVTCVRKLDLNQVFDNNRLYFFLSQIRSSCLFNLQTKQGGDALNFERVWRSAITFPLLDYQSKQDLSMQTPWWVYVQFAVGLSISAGNSCFSFQLSFEWWIYVHSERAVPCSPAWSHCSNLDEWQRNVYPEHHLSLLLNGWAPQESHDWSCTPSKWTVSKAAWCVDNPILFTCRFFRHVVPLLKYLYHRLCSSIENCYIFYLRRAAQPNRWEHVGTTQFLPFCLSEKHFLRNVASIFQLVYEFHK